MAIGYKDFISTSHIAEHRKTWHIENGKHIQNQKRRACVQRRLKKLSKYVRRAWNGYTFGRLVPKVRKLC